MKRIIYKPTYPKSGSEPSLDSTDDKNFYCINCPDPDVILILVNILMIKRKIFGSSNKLEYICSQKL